MSTRNRTKPASVPTRPEPDRVDITEQNDICKGTVETDIQVDGVSYRVRYTGEMDGCNNDDGGYQFDLKEVRHNGEPLDISRLPRRVYWMINFQTQVDFIDRIIPPHDFKRHS